jgi:hypothetical protein
MAYVRIEWKRVVESRIHATRRKPLRYRENRSIASFLRFRLTSIFGPKKWHMSGQRWRATRCDGADFLARGFGVPLAAPEPKTRSLPRVTVCVTRGRAGGGGSGPFYLYTQDNCAAGEGLT